MERRERDDGVELRALRPPGLEVGVDHIDPGKECELSACHRGEGRAELDARDAQPTSREWKGRFPWVAADLEDT